VDDVAYSILDGGENEGATDAPPLDDAAHPAPCAARSDFDASCIAPAVPDSSCTNAPSTCSVETLVDPPEGPLVDGGPSATAYTFPFGIAVDDAFVYWTTQDDYDHSVGVRGALRRARKDRRGPAETLAVEQPGPRGVAVDDRYVYWVTTGPGPLVQRISKCAPACDRGSCAVEPEVIAPTTTVLQAGPIFVIGSEVVAVGVDGRFYAYRKQAESWLEESGHTFPPQLVSTFARGAEDLFVTYGNVVERLTLDFQLRNSWTWTSGTQTLVVASDCTSAFLVPSPERSLVALFNDGGSRIVSPAPPGLVYAAVADARFVYLGFANAGGIWRLPKDGTGGPDILASGSAWSIAVDDTAVYWGEHGSDRSDFRGEIRRLLK
jgi:hypothetical protein